MKDNSLDSDNDYRREKNKLIFNRFSCEKLNFHLGIVHKLRHVLEKRRGSLDKKGQEMDFLKEK